MVEKKSGHGETKYTLITYNLQGHVIDGKGKDIKKDWSLHKYFLGYNPYPGTLNIRLKESLKVRDEDIIRFYPYIKGIHFMQKTNILLPAIINKEIECHIPFIRPIIRKINIHVIAPVNLREYFGLKNEDIVDIQVMTLMK